MENPLKSISLRKNKVRNEKGDTNKEKEDSGNVKTIF